MRFQPQEEQRFSVGDRAPRTGVYLVAHQRHRLSHLSLAREGDIFPPCHKCGRAVRFTLHQRAQFIDADADFFAKGRMLARNRVA